MGFPYLLSGLLLCLIVSDGFFLLTDQVSYQRFTLWLLKNRVWGLLHSNAFAAWLRLLRQQRAFKKTQEASSPCGCERKLEYMKPKDLKVGKKA